MNKSRKKTPKALLEAAFSNYINAQVPECFGLLSEIAESDLAGLDKSLFQKTLILLLVGEFFGCHTLNQILSVEMVKSGAWHTRLASLTYRQIELAVCAILKEEALNALTDLAQKSESSWSRAAVSLVIDDSIFKQWLTHGKVDPATAEFFDRFFSGQSKSVVYGFRITLCGLAIDDTFYPMYFTLTKKTDNTRQIACDLLNQAHKDITLMCKKEELTLPNLFLSVDSGFHGLELLNLCATFATTILPITLVCVPKNNHIIEIQATKDTPEFRGKLPEFIDKHFKIAEAKFYEDPNNEDEHFTMRLKINYVSVDTELIILIFRFKKSQKVSVIYTTDLNIKAKTLRHRWFQRTHIEQFFRLLKDTLKIQLSKSTDKNGFVKKFCIKLFQALHIQLFRNYCRRRFRYFRKMAFPTIRLLMIAHLDILEIFKKYSI
jgi:Transposase DDE domain